MIDIRNHAAYQKSFDLEGLPFLGLIIGPYSQKNRNEALCKVFHIVKEKQPFSLSFKQVPTKKLRKGLIDDIREILMKYQKHEDKINLREKWSGQLTREGKLVEAIEMLLQKSFKGKERNEAMQ